MSDNEYDDSDNDSVSSSDSDSKNINKKPNLFKPKIVTGPTIDGGEEDDDDDDQIGGVGDDDEPDDIMSIVSSDEDASDAEEEESDEENLEEGISEAIVGDANKKTKTKKPVQIDLPSDDEDEDYDDSYLQKFDHEVTKNYINDFHPECLIHNYDEITKLTSVVRDSNNIIVDPLHKTIPFLTKYEKARILGQRAKQIETGAKPFISVPENVIDGYVIAELELQQKRIPFIIRRPVPGGAFEYWNLRDLEVIGF
jgi:DNA-directed RNA polymerase I, II, and III subunit RPABC2